MTRGWLLTLYLLGFVRGVLGDHQGASDACREAVTRSQSLGETWGGSYALWVLAFDAWTRQDLDVAEDLAKQSLELRHGFRDDLGEALVINLIAGIAVDNGDAKKAAKLLGIVATTLAMVGFEVTGVLASRYEPITRAAQERLGEDAFSRYYEIGRRLDPAQRMSVALGRATAGQEQPGAVSSADLLTPREKELASLLASGLSNRAIATKLVLSQRTVEAHVNNILTKLGVRSRTEAGLWAAEALKNEN